MVELARGRLAPPTNQKIRFTQITPIDKSGRANVLSNALGLAAKGSIKFAKSNAASAGAEAGVEQLGLDLPESQVNTEVDSLNESIARGLSTEQDAVEGPIDARTVNSLRDASLREATLTDRHIQGLIDSGSISSTEGNARRRISLSDLKNRGSNFLFQDEFDNAFFSVTGGSRGKASSAIFPKTAEEMKQEAITQERVKVEADFEGQKQALQLLFPEMSGNSIQSELTSQFINERRTAELELQQKERSLNGDDSAQLLDLTQANVTRALEAQMGQMLQETGKLGQGDMLVLQTRVAQTKQALEEQIANTPNLTASGRKAAQADIDAWVLGANNRFEVSSGKRIDKETLDVLNVAKEKFGVLASPFTSMLAASGQIKLVEEINTIPKKNIPRRIKLRLGEGGFKNLEEGAKVLRDIALFTTNSKSKPKDLGNVALTLATKEGRKLAGTEENRSKWVDVYLGAADVAFNTLSGIFSSGVDAPEDKNEKTAILDLFNISQIDLTNKMGLKRTAAPTVRIQKDPSGFIPDRIIMDIPEALQSIVGVEDTLSESYITMKRNPWLWKDKGFDNAADAFNAYITGGLSLDPEKFDALPEGEGTAVKTAKPSGAKTTEPLSVQNNNPANLRSFGKVSTVDTPSGKFVKFPSIEEGVRAAARNFTTKLSRGDNSIEEIINQQSPDSDPENVKRGFTNEPFKEFVSKEMGKGRDVVLTEADLPKLLKAIFAFESGSKSGVSEEQILQGIEDAKIDR